MVTWYGYLTILSHSMNNTSIYLIEKTDLMDVIVVMYITGIGWTQIT